ncbi:hypothetical protein [Escherichia phage vB_EcoM-569R5]|nr:hypothetical protein [Escherichia phage vB_EcoM-569R5]URE76760.1 hypothetical protein [Escherichia phage vB_EcoM-705R2]
MVPMATKTPSRTIALLMICSVIGFILFHP